MNIRKHWKKILLSSTALFWASCGGDSESTPVAGGTTNDDPVTPDSIVKPDDLDGIKIDTLYGIRPIYNADTGEVTSNHTCNCDTIYVEDTTSVESSSSEAVPPSSSDSSPTFKLASDPNATCKLTGFVPTGACEEFVETSTPKSSEPSVRELMDQLEGNTTETLEELNKIEEKLENTPDFSEVALGAKR